MVFAAVVLIVLVAVWVGLAFLVRVRFRSVVRQLGSDLRRDAPDDRRDLAVRMVMQRARRAGRITARWPVAGLVLAIGIVLCWSHTSDGHNHEMLNWW